MTFTTRDTGPGARLLAQSAGRERLVATLNDRADAIEVAASLSRLHELVRLDGFESVLHRLRAAGLDLLCPAADDLSPSGGVAWHPTRLLGGPRTETILATEGGIGAVLRVLTTAEAQTDSARGALRTVVAGVLSPLEGVVVRADYEDFGQLNVAPWIDETSVDDLRSLVSDGFRFQSVTRRWLRAWAAPGGPLEEERDRIAVDGDGGLVVDIPDVVRRLITTRPSLIPEVFSPGVVRRIAMDGYPDCVEGLEVARTVARLPVGPPDRGSASL